MVSDCTYVLSARCDLTAAQDYIDALTWADAEGGVPGLIKRSRANLGVIEKVLSPDWLLFALLRQIASSQMAYTCRSTPAYDWVSVALDAP